MAEQSNSAAAAAAFLANAATVVTGSASSGGGGGEGGGPGGRGVWGATAVPGSGGESASGTTKGAIGDVDHAFAGAMLQRSSSAPPMSDHVSLSCSVGHVRTSAFPCFVRACLV